jgi:hypothetical protein
MAGLADPSSSDGWTPPPPSEPSTPIWKRSWLWVAVGAAVLVLLFVGINVHINFGSGSGGSSGSLQTLPTPRSPVTAGSASCNSDAASCTITGVIFLDAQRQEPALKCVGAGVNRDIHSGAHVTVTDASDRQVGVATLRDGVETQGQCDFQFAIVVPNIASYNLAVNGRAPLVFPRDVLQAQGWAVTLSVS